MTVQAALATMPLAGFSPCPDEHANALVVEWGHNLGACNRPFDMRGWVLDIAGQPISTAITASTVSETVAGYHRSEVIELARLCTDPAERWATRVMLRMWRELTPPLWPHWPVKALVAYSQNDRHEGRIYRFDGWTKVTDRAGHSGGGGAWTRKRYASDAANGYKTLWVYELSESRLT